MEQHFGDFKEKGKGRCGGTCYVRWYVRTGTFCLTFIQSFLEAEGIRCKMFAPIKPVFSTHYNNRDHRKIMVIDGKVAFTGGTNLADEYINQKERFGHWKDTAVMLKGECRVEYDHDVSSYVECGKRHSDTY